MKRFAWALAMTSVMTGCSSMPFGNSQEADIVKASQLYERGEALYGQGNLGAAEPLLKEAEKLSPNDPRVLYRLGTIRFRAKDPQGAADYFVKVTAVDPRNAKAHYNLALIRLEQAEDSFKYFTATTDPKTNVDDIGKLLADIEAFYASTRKQR